MSHDDVFRNGVALLAFVIAFYALIAREHKTPDMVHAVYRIAFLVLAAVFLGVISDFAERIVTGGPQAASSSAGTAMATTTPGMSATPSPPSNSIPVVPP